MSAHRMCTSCEVPHAENCETCFGFGLWQLDNGERLIISAYEAHEGKPYWPFVSTRGRTLVVCPECGGGTLNRGPAKAVTP